MPEMSNSDECQRYLDTLTCGLVLDLGRCIDVNKAAKRLHQLGCDPDTVTCFHWYMDRRAPIDELIAALEKSGITLPTEPQAFRYLACGHLVEMLGSDRDPLEAVQEFSYLLECCWDEYMEADEFYDEFAGIIHQLDDSLSWHFAEEFRADALESARRYLRKFNPTLLASVGKNEKYFPSDSVSMWTHEADLRLPKESPPEIPNYIGSIGNWPGGLLLDVLNTDTDAPTEQPSLDTYVISVQHWAPELIPTFDTSQVSIGTTAVKPIAERVPDNRMIMRVRRFISSLYSEIQTRVRRSFRQTRNSPKA